MLLHKSNLKCHLKFICDTSNIWLLPNQAQAKDEDNRIKNNFVRTEIENFKTWVFTKMLAGELHWHVLCNIQIYFYSFWSENYYGLSWLVRWPSHLKIFLKDEKGAERCTYYAFFHMTRACGCIFMKGLRWYMIYILMCPKLDLG